MDHHALKSELADAAYAGLSDAEAAAAVNASREPIARAVSSDDVRAVLFARGKWIAIVKKANAARSGADMSDAAALCQVIYDLASSGGRIDMIDAATAAAVTSALAALVADAILSPDDADALLGLSVGQESWAVRHLGSPASTHDVSVARSL